MIWLNRIAASNGDSIDKKICGRREIYEARAPPAIICGGSGGQDEKEANNCVSLYHEHDATQLR